MLSAGIFRQSVFRKIYKVTRYAQPFKKLSIIFATSNGLSKNAKCPAPFITHTPASSMYDAIIFASSTVAAVHIPVYEPYHRLTQDLRRRFVIGRAEMAARSLQQIFRIFPYPRQQQYPLNELERRLTHLLLKGLFMLYTGGAEQNNLVR